MQLMDQHVRELQEAWLHTQARRKNERSIVTGCKAIGSPQGPGYTMGNLTWVTQHQGVLYLNAGQCMLDLAALLFRHSYSNFRPFGPSVRPSLSTVCTSATLRRVGTCQHGSTAHASYLPVGQFVRKTINVYTN